MLNIIKGVRNDCVLRSGMLISQDSEVRERLQKAKCQDMNIHRQAK